MSILSRREPLWWDRELDYSGRPIRTDVRAAAHEIWPHACARTQVVLGDSGDAAELMEKSVSQVSRYLDRPGAAPHNNDTAALLMCAYLRALRRHAMKLSRLKLVGSMSDLADSRFAYNCASQQDCRLDAEKAGLQLSNKTRTMLELRIAGFGWKEIARMLDMTDSAAQAEFSRAIRKVRLKNNRPEDRK